MRFCLVFFLLFVESVSALAGVVPEGKCAFTVASRQTLPEVRTFVNEVMHPSHLPYVRVALSQNGWYAISVGDVPINDFSAIKNRLVRLGEVPSDSFCSSGSKYVSIIARDRYLSSSANSSQRTATRQRDVDCGNYDREIAACYALTLGPKVCSQYISAERIPGADTFAERVAISSLCSASTNATFARDFLPGDVVGVIIDETLESGCEQIENDNILMQLFVGIPFCVTNAARWAAKLDASNACARHVENVCR